MNTNEKQDGKFNEGVSKLYISVDHLKSGAYQLHLMCKEKIIKTIKFKKK